MDCPQCAAEVPSDNAFCGKCGYAMRDDGPERTDHSRIRMHEEPTPTNEDRGKRESSPRIRKHTKLGMPQVEMEEIVPPVSEPPPPPPASLASARRARRTPQKTMLGIPRPEIPDPRGQMPPPPAEAAPSETDAKPGGSHRAGSHRARAHVQYDSVLEPPPVTARRRRVFGGVAVLVALSAGWLIYRFLNG